MTQIKIVSRYDSSVVLWEGDAENVRELHMKLVEAGYRTIASADHRYMINQNGDILSLFDSCGLREVPKQIKCSLTPSGYLYAHLRGDGKRRAGAFLHRLLAEAFLGLEIRDLRKEVNHLNGNKVDNRLCNLQVCSRSENRRHAERLGLIPRKRGFTKNEIEDLRAGQEQITLPVREVIWR